jgi:DNA-binding LacI/PurR family transcriptional regulator
MSSMTSLGASVKGAGRSGATLRSVAELAGVSTATVARVLRESDLVAPQTRERVSEAIQATGYRINAVASGLRRQRTETIGHILHGISPNPFFAGVALGLQEQAAEAGFEVMMFNAQNQPARERVGVEAFLSRRVDAIVFTTPLAAENVKLAVDGGVRVVQVERPTTVPSAAVLVDNYVGSRAAVEHLVDLGHTEIAFIGGDPAGEADSPEAQRLGGYLDGIEFHGLQPRTVLGSYGDPTDPAYQDLGAEYLRTLLAGGRIPTAVFAGSDLLAAGVLQALHDARIWVPEQVSVVGFDDTYAAHLPPPLTTVALPMHEMGAAAFRCIESAKDNRVERLTTTLKVRRSTSPGT